MKKCFFFFNLFLHIKIPFDYLYHNLENILYKIYSERVKRQVLFICIHFSEINDLYFCRSFLYFYFIFIMKNSKIDITYEIIRKEKKEENQIEVFFENFFTSLIL